MRSFVRPQWGREAAVARNAIDGDAVKSGLDMPTLALISAVDRYRNGRNGAASGQSAISVVLKQTSCSAKLSIHGKKRSITNR